MISSRPSLRWLDCPPHPCPPPLASESSRDARQQRVLEAARLLQLPGPDTPSAFLPGVWQGSAVLIKGREAHPTASKERAQELSWVLGLHDGELKGELRSRERLVA